MAKGFVYRGSKRTADSIAQKSSEGARDYDSIFKPGIPVYKPKEGSNTVRILPSASEDDPDWDMTIYSHYNVGPDNGRYLCLAKMKDEDCPVCNAALEATDEDEQRDLNAGKGAICWVIDRDNEKAGPQLWSIPFTKVRNEIHTRSVDKKTKTPILVDHPEEGYDVDFSRKGKDKTTQYTGVEVSRDSTPLHDNEKIQDRWLDYIAEHPLAEVLNFYDADYIEKVLSGRKAPKKGKEADDDEAELPARSSRRSRDPDPEDEEMTGSSRRRAEKEKDPDEEDYNDGPKNDRVSRRRAILDEPKDKDDDVPFDKDDKEDETPRRGRREAAEDETPVGSARRSLERLKAGGRGR